MVLDLLWRQWCALGVAGNAPPAGLRVIDIEPLLLATCTFGRLDPRLFDEALDWLHGNGELVATQRLRRLVKTHAFAGGEALSAVGFFLSKGDRSARWRQLSASQAAEGRKSPFFLLDEKGLPTWGKEDLSFAQAGFSRGRVELRRMSTAFDPSDPACLQIRLRCLMGTNVRADLLSFLLTHQSGAHPSWIAREIDYAQSATQNAMATMARSALLRRRGVGRQQVYTPAPSLRGALMDSTRSNPIWWPWAHQFRLAELIWLHLGDSDFIRADELVQATVLRKSTATAMTGLAAVDPGPLADLQSSRQAQRSPQAFVDATCAMLEHILEA